MNELSGVRTGVTLILYQIILMLLLMAGGFAGGFAVAASGSIEAVGLFAMVIGFFAIAASVLGMIGKFMCMSAPAETEGKNLIIGSVVLDLISILIVIGTLLKLISPQIAQSNNLVGLVSHILFLLFLKKIALYINRSDLADKSQNVLNLMVAIFVCAIGMMILMFVLGPLAVLIGLVVLVLAILMVVRYIGLIVGMKAALERATGM